MVKMKWDCRLSTGLPSSSWLCRLWSRKGDLQQAWNRDRKAVWDQVGLSNCRHEGLVMVLGRSPPQTRPWWSIMSGSPMYRDIANRRIPVSHKYPPGDLNMSPLWQEANRKSTGPVRHGENEVRLQALHNSLITWFSCFCPAKFSLWAGPQTWIFMLSFIPGPWWAFSTLDVLNSA
jgi:hypothetical protein